MKSTSTFDGGRGVVLDSLKEENADHFSGRRLESFTAIACRFIGCRFERMHIEDANFGAGRSDSEYVDCSFDGSRIRAEVAGSARFVRCSFRDVVIRNLLCHRVEFVECVFSGKLHVGYFNGTVPEDNQAWLGRSTNEFRDNDFSQMELIDVAFRTGIDLSKQKLPTDPMYLYVPDAVAAVANARKQVIEWKDLKRRQEAMKVIRFLELELEGGQQQLFMRPKGLMPRKWREVSEEIFSLLRDAQPK
ncbi:MAG: hypothetical protein NVSMB23_08480 [Myxococcales bacterium]